jgi:hypothetical protein
MNYIEYTPINRVLPGLNTTTDKELGNSVPGASNESVCQILKISLYSIFERMSNLEPGVIVP